jgi:hypothetical protein
MDVGQLFSSAPHAWRRARQAAAHDAAAPVGRVAAAQACGRGRPKRWAKRAGSTEWVGLAAGLAKCFQAKIKDLNRWALDLIFRIDFKDFEFKIKGFKYFKLDFELRSN